VHERGLTAVTGCAALALAFLMLAGCGDDGAEPQAEDTSSAASPSAANDAPDCGAVWQEAAELPRSYDGCNSDEGFVTPDTLGCSSGQRIVRYGDQFYAVPGGTIHETESPLEDDHGYRDALASCRA
jgi:hypothetical protein